MDSFAFWYRKKSADNNTGKDLTAVMNFNLWCECGWDQKKNKSGVPPREIHPYLDIGFKLENLSLASSLYFFLPVGIDDSEKALHIEDLGCKYKATALVDATFNESFKTTISASEKTINVSSEKETFLIYQLDIENDISLSQFSTGTILTIDTKKILDNHPDSADEFQNDPVYYFRFRIKGCPLDFLIHEYSSRSKVLQSLFNVTYMIDFRYHNIRSLDNSLIERFHEKENQIVKVKALHFLLMTKAYVDVTGRAFSNVRKIESEVWKDYVGGQDTTDLLAYHFADKAKLAPFGSFDLHGAFDTASASAPKPCYIESSELFTKFRIERSVMLKYVCFTILLGAFGSILATALLKIWELLF